MWIFKATTISTSPVHCSCFQKQSWKLHSFILNLYMLGVPHNSYRLGYVRLGQVWFPKFVNTGFTRSSHSSKYLCSLLRDHSNNTWHSRAGMHNSNLKRAKKNLVAYPRARIDIFVPILREYFQANRLNRSNFGLCGPNKKLPRATFGPRAVCCARLI